MKHVVAHTTRPRHAPRVFGGTEQKGIATGSRATTAPPPQQRRLRAVHWPSTAVAKCLELTDAALEAQARQTQKLHLVGTDAGKAEYNKATTHKIEKTAQTKHATRFANEAPVKELTLRE